MVTLHRAGRAPESPLTLLNITTPGRHRSHSQDTRQTTQNTMAPAKTAYTVTVRRNILSLLVKTRRNIKKMYRELEESLQLERDQLEQEMIDESEQNRYNELLERSLAVN